MAVGYDGTIKIDTSINADGMNKGTKQVTANLKGVFNAVKAVGVAIGLAFTGSFIANFVRSAVGQFDLMGSKFGGVVNDLQYAFWQLQGAVANVALEGLAILAPYLIMAMNFITQLLNVVAKALIVFFGLQNVLQGVSDKLKIVGKGASGALASFDQLNVLNAKSALPDLGDLGNMEGQLEDFKNKFLAFIQPVVDALGRLYDALLPLGQTIWEGLKWAWDNIIVPFGTWVVQEAVPAFLDLLAAGASVLNEALIALKPLGQWLYDNFLKPLGEWTGDLIIQALKWLTDRLNDLAAWIKANPQMFDAIVVAIVLLVATVWLAVQVFSVLVAIGEIVTGVMLMFGVAIAGLPIAIAIGIILLLIGVIINLIIWWPILSKAAEDAWKAVVALWQYASYWFQANVVDKINAVFMSVWTRIWLGFWDLWRRIQNLWGGLGDGLTTAFKSTIEAVRGLINQLIDLMNGLFAGVALGINAMIAGANAAGSIVPGWATIPNVQPIKIPRLATGAVIPPNAAFAAILGDQTSGMNVEAPADLIRQIVREELANSGGGDMTITTPVYLDSEKIWEGQQRVSRRRGNTLIPSTRGMA